MHVSHHPDARASHAHAFGAAPQGALALRLPGAPGAPSSLTGVLSFVTPSSSGSRETTFITASCGEMTTNAARPAPPVRSAACSTRSLPWLLLGHEMTHGSPSKGRPLLLGGRELNPEIMSTEGRGRPVTWSTRNPICPEAPGRPLCAEGPAPLAAAAPRPLGPAAPFAALRSDRSDSWLLLKQQLSRPDGMLATVLHYLVRRTLCGAMQHTPVLLQLRREERAETKPRSVAALVTLSMWHACWPYIHGS